MSSMSEETRAPTTLSSLRLTLDRARVTDEVLAHPYPGAGTTESPFIVSFLPFDPGNPFTWSKSYKWTCTMLAAVSTLSTAFASSAYSGTLRELVTGFEPHPSLELLTAGISLFVLGFAVGPLLWAPLSEIYGRQPIFIITFGAFTAFNAACAGAQNVGTLLVLRFFAGAFGSSPFTNAGGVIADMFDASERGLAMSLFALAPSLGPTLGPFCAGFLGESPIGGWRWVMGLMAIFSGVLWVAQTIFVPETYAPVLLKKRAEKLSKMTGKVYKSSVEVKRGEISIKAVMVTSLTRPWVLLFMEPIVLILSIYLAIVYGTLYLLFGAYPIVFQGTRHWSEGVSGLAFLGIAVGMITAIAISPYINRLYMRAAEKNGGVAPPEARLIGCMWGGIAIPVGMFWFAWSSGPIVPVMAGAPFGFGLVLIFLSVVSYLIDAYVIFAASVLAANTVLRSLFGAAFPLFTEQMYTNLGLHWASSVPAFLALACLPFPFILYKYGAAIRKRCVYASEVENIMNDLRAQAVEKKEDQDEAERKESQLAVDSDSLSDLDVEKAAEPRFEPIRTRTRARSRASNGGSMDLKRTRSRTGSIAEAAAYQASPYDIDRVMTGTSVKGLDELRKTRTRTED